jgi:hypothetical protein
MAGGGGGPPPAVAALGLLLATTAGCASTGTPPAPPKRALIEFIVIDADQHGAIVADLRRAEFLGVTRDGTVVWRSPQATAAPDASACAGHCPDALLSGNATSQNAEDIPDPLPVLIRGGRREAVGGDALAGRIKRNVLVAADGGDYVVTAGGPGRWTLDAVRPGVAPVRTPVPGPAAAWARTADRRHGLAVVATADPTRSAAVWFTHAADGWRPEPDAPVPVTGSSACLGPDGDRAMLLGDRPAVRFRDGHTQSVTDLDYVSDCGFAATGGILGKYGQGEGGVTARIRVFGPDGSVTRRVDTRATVRVTADPTGARVAYATAGKTIEIDPGTGRVLRTIDDTYGARYDDAGDLVVLDRDGRPRWL